MIKIRKRFGNLLARPDQWKKIIKAATLMKAAAPFSPVSDHLTETPNFGETLARCECSATCQRLCRTNVRSLSFCTAHAKRGRL